MGNAAPTLGIVIDSQDLVTSERYGGVGVARAGRQLCGKVFAEIATPMPATRLLLRVVGEEIISVPSSNTSRKSKRLILQINLTFDSFIVNNELPPGRYTYPYRFDLPHTLPSSMAYFKSSNSWCQLDYKVVAVLQTPKRAYSKKNTIERELLVVSAPLPPDPVPYLMAPVTKNVKSMRFFKHGSITFGVSIDDTRVGRGQDVDLALACRNNSDVDVERIEVKIKEVISWQGTTFQCDKITLVADNMAIPIGLDKKSKRDLRRENSPGEHYVEIYTELASKRNVIKLQIPEGARDTYTGQLISIDHSLTVKIKTRSGTDDPKVKIPLQIGCPPSAMAESWTEVPMPSAPPRPVDIQSLREMALPSAPPTAPECDIPVARAVPLGWSGTNTAPLSDSLRSAIMGGNAAEVNGEEEHIISSVTEPSATVTLQNLLEEMFSSVDDFDIIRLKIQESEWLRVFVALTPSEYGSIIAHVNKDHDQPKIAALIAPCIDEGLFTCDYIIAALRNSVDWNRVPMLQKLLPLCSDIENGQESVKRELNEWELAVAENDITAAVQKWR